VHSLKAFSSYKLMRAWRLELVLAVIALVHHHPIQSVPFDA
jgi:hypothetical protein